MKTEADIKDGKLEFAIDLYDLVSSVSEETKSVCGSCNIGTNHG